MAGRHVLAAADPGVLIRDSFFIRADAGWSVAFEVRGFPQPQLKPLRAGGGIPL
jgi:hypothetical protein